jgi:hypothetical protein
MLGLQAKTLDFLGLEDDGLLHLYPLEGVVIEGLFGLYPKIALPKFWLANILVELFLAHKLAKKMN